MHPSRIQQSWALLSLGLVSTALQAQTVPDAGSLRQHIEQQRQAAPSAFGISPQATALPQVKSLDGMTVTVTSFAFTGNQLLSQAQLDAALASFLNRPLSFGELQRAADAVTAAYREAGWLARVSLPEQDISEGRVLLQIVEARYSGYRFEGSPSLLVQREHIEAFFSTRLTPGQPLNTASLDRGLLLADDLPGVSVAGTLVAGQNEGDTALVLQTTDEAMVFGDVGLDNHGSRSTGSQRLTANMNINSPGGRGELVSLSLLRTQGSDYARVGMTVPDGYNGLRLGMSLSSMAYKVVQGDQVTNDVRGGSSSLGLDWNYAVLRDRAHNLSLTGGLDYKTFHNTDNIVNSPNHGDYASNSLRLGVSGSLFDQWGGGGANSATLQATWGELVEMQLHRQIDTLPRQFKKINYSLSRQQTLSADHSLLLTVSGQHAIQVLDPSERFYIGGIQTVRAYPASEVPGDRGQMLSTEWRWRVAPTWVVTAFADLGRAVELSTTAATPSRRLLRGQGLSLGWQGPMGINTKLTWSRRSGTNPMTTIAGTDSDGTLTRDRFWLSASLPF